MSSDLNNNKTREWLRWLEASKLQAGDLRKLSFKRTDMAEQNLGSDCQLRWWLVAVRVGYSTTSKRNIF